ncbi:stage V sporulation protein AB [Paenibacillus sp. J2TS4]|uniref:stage V sporulation protein AB n=1 Tax=Paenibacillus sp. J2TS4 TaxID=2807194 RepID=UPI001B0DD25D|nr:stage V sporulation protein AB [Paenibacillus sp. J2TS4]GIP32330.1 stage V sporulation protein AB [Paenibacillus sp. J2TS4]
MLTMNLVSLLQVLIGLAGGLVVGTGMVAFLIVLDIIPRLAQVTKSQRFIHWYEGAVISGSLYWTFADFFHWKTHLTPFSTAFFGFFAGGFVGLLAAALTEIINVLPILAKRLGLGQYVILFLMAMIFGKVIGSLLEWFLF